MDEIFTLFVNGETQLWTRERAAEMRLDAEKRAATLEADDVLVVDARCIEVFDYSFAAEFFGKLILTFRSIPDRYLQVRNLNETSLENLEMALKAIELVMVRESGSHLALVGRRATVDDETFAAIADTGRWLSPSIIANILGLSVNAVNERLKKLYGLGLIMRRVERTAAGREQFVYARFAK